MYQTYVVRLILLQEGLIGIGLLLMCEILLLLLLILMLQILSLSLAVHIGLRLLTSSPIIQIHVIPLKSLCITVAVAKPRQILLVMFQDLWTRSVPKGF